MFAPQEHHHENSTAVVVSASSWIVALSNGQQKDTEYTHSTHTYLLTNPWGGKEINTHEIPGGRQSLLIKSVENERAI